MNLLARGCGRAVRLAGLTVVLAATSSLALAGPPTAPVAASYGTGRVIRTRDTQVLRASVAVGNNETTAVDRPKPQDGEVPVKFDGTPVAGSRITVSLNGEADPNASYRWVQVEGPPTLIDDPTHPVIGLTVPDGAERLVFEVTQTIRGEARTARVVVPIGQARGVNNAPTAPTADAGDDQVGLVGRRMTLNGSYRGASDRVGLLWFQLNGPKVEQPTQDRTYFSFIPPRPGVYVFGLIVASCASGNAVPAISEPDQIVVTIGETPVSSTPTATTPLDQAVRTARTYASRETLDQVAGVFESISERAPLYSSFIDYTNEMGRRLDSVIPTDPNSRQLWAQGIFAPLTQHIVTEMRPTGLELTAAQGLYQALNAAQKEKLQTLFGIYSREFRSRSLTR